MPVDAQKVQVLKGRVEAAKTQKVQAETRMDGLRKQRDGVVEELKAEGLTPETLDPEITKLTGEMEGLAADIETLLSGT